MSTLREKSLDIHQATAHDAKGIISSEISDENQEFGLCMDIPAQPTAELAGRLRQGDTPGSSAPGETSPGFVLGHCPGSLARMDCKLPLSMPGECLWSRS